MQGQGTTSKHLKWVHQGGVSTAGGQRYLREHGMKLDNDVGLVPPHQGRSEWADCCASIALIQGRQRQIKPHQAVEGAGRA